MAAEMCTVGLDDPIIKHIRKDYPSLRHDMTIQDALTAIRLTVVGERVIYFYVLDETERLVGVVPTRRLLTAELDKPISQVMIGRVVSVPQTAKVLDACELFAMYRFFALPVVDEQQHMVGIVDVGLFTEEVFDLAERQQSETIFESIGLRIEQVRGASPLKAFYLRFRWLMATIASGMICALLVSAYEVTLAHVLALAFFLPLVLGLGESVSVQSMTVTLQILRTSRPSLSWYLKALQREILTAALLGVACGAIVGLIAWLWRGALVIALAIGSGILLSLCVACLFGISVPALVHRFKLDPKIAAGPITLALTDVSTLVCYFTIATVLM